mgnify:CR=1 FL=1
MNFLNISLLENHLSVFIQTLKLIMILSVTDQLQNELQAIKQIHTKNIRSGHLCMFVTDQPPARF